MLKNFGILECKINSEIVFWTDFLIIFGPRPTTDDLNFHLNTELPGTKFPCGLPAFCKALFQLLN